MRGLLRVTVPSTFGRPLIAAWAGSFLDRYPDIKLELSVTDRRVDLIRESFDIAVRIGELQDTSLIGRSLGVLHYVLAASPRYLDRRGMPRSIDDLKQHACLRYLRAGRPFPFTFADATRIVPEGPFDTDDAQYLIEAALEGAGITRFMRLAIQDDLANGRLRIVLPEIPMVTEPIHVLPHLDANFRCVCACSSIFWLRRSLVFLVDDAGTTEWGLAAIVLMDCGERSTPDMGASRSRLAQLRESACFLE